ncbi:MAG: hypothetical protein AAF152_03385 [Cyanobacteria bacterium P01_A01_bin.114]
MRARKSQKLDLNEDYPCPCRRRGRIQPIVLTEAFGCDRCQQIFVLREDGYVIEQLSSHYPYRRSWRWSGHQWTISRPTSPFYYLLILAIAFFAVIVMFWLWTVQFPNSMGELMKLGFMVMILLFIVAVLLMAVRR